MAGWSMIGGDDNTNDNNNANNPSKTFQSNKLGEPAIDLKNDDSLRCRFDDCLKSFRQEIHRRALDIAFPPMLGNGQCVDLYKLYLIVRDKGGYDAVSENGLWDVVADESGFGINFASSVKLVYAKYLDALEKLLVPRVVVVDADDGDKISKSKLSDDRASNVVVGGVSPVDGLGFEFKRFSDWKSALNVCAEFSSNVGSDKCIVDDEESSVHIGTAKGGVDFQEFENSNYNMAKGPVIDVPSNEDKKCKGDVQENFQSNSMSVKTSDEDEVKSDVVEMNWSEKSDNGIQNDVIILGSSTVEESNSVRKRKRESVCKMLQWITGIARNPCDDAVASLPECSKWESYGKEELWKQILSARDSLFLKRNVDTGAEQSSGQKNRKMHPCMYEDHVGSMYNFRERLKCSKKQISGKLSSHAQACSQLSSSTTETDSDSNTKLIYNDGPSAKHSLLDLPAEKTIPVGPDFQAEVPEWTGVVWESEPKWAGTRIWPLERVDNRFVVEREPIGKGRQDSCGCEVPNSVKCVRFHITERRMRMKRELSIAFYHWRFDRMGEDVKLCWTKEEEKKFEAIVRSNPPSLGKCFWDEIIRSFPDKRTRDLVSYYFNVFLIQRRAHQNRFTLNNIDSDDDESECGVAPNISGCGPPKSPCSLLYSAKKSRKSGR